MKQHHQQYGHQLYDDNVFVPKKLNLGVVRRRLSVLDPNVFGRPPTERSIRPSLAVRAVCVSFAHEETWEIKLDRVAAFVERQQQLQRSRLERWTRDGRITSGPSFLSSSMWATQLK
jgi:hypothetical protein